MKIKNLIKKPFIGIILLILVLNIDFSLSDEQRKFNYSFYKNTKLNCEVKIKMFFFIIIK